MIVDDFRAIRRNRLANKLSSQFGLPKILIALACMAVVACSIERSQQSKTPVAQEKYDNVPALSLGAPMDSIVASPVAEISQSYQTQPIANPSLPVDREKYAAIKSNAVKQVAEAPVSTFSIDVDTGAYANVRRILNEGRLPPHNAVRVEEMLNYFSYDYARPNSIQPPFQVTTEMGQTPWNPNTQLLLIGLQGYDVPAQQLPPANLVFLLDVSGSMQAPNKLPLLKSALSLLSKQLRPQDRVSIVVYAGASGLVLAPTNDTVRIQAALSQLSAGGSTNGGAGIQLAYQVARQQYIEQGVNRVILATDGDFNVGTVNTETLKDLIRDNRQNGIALTTLGFGGGNYNDHLMEQLADVGNGNYAYIDNLQEARKTLVQEMGSTLLTIAKDVKIQIEFNPAQVAEYRLIGYENRVLQREDFNNDAVDAGEIGAGHTVTALYEVALQGSGGTLIDPLRYQPSRTQINSKNAELAFLRLRYKMPDSDRSQLLQYPIKPQALTGHRASNNLRFASAVAAFGQYLRGGQYLQNMQLATIRALAAGARGEDKYGYRSELLQLIDLAAALSGKSATTQITN